MAYMPRLRFRSRTRKDEDSGYATDFGVSSDSGSSLSHSAAVAPAPRVPSASSTRALHGTAGGSESPSKAGPVTFDHVRSCSPTGGTSSKIPPNGSAASGQYPMLPSLVPARVAPAPPAVLPTAPSPPPTPPSATAAHPLTPPPAAAVPPLTPPPAAAAPPLTLPPAAAAELDGARTRILLVSDSPRSNSGEWEGAFVDHAPADVIEDQDRRAAEDGTGDSFQHGSSDISAEPESEDDEYEEVDEEIQVHLPKFRPLPGLLVWPNLPMLVFWLFNTGLVKKSTALLAWQVSVGELGAAKVNIDAAPEASCGWSCTTLAIFVLACVAAMLAVSYLMLRTFWREFRDDTWKPTKPAIQANEVSDPLFRCWSQIKRGVDRLICCTPPPVMPTDTEVTSTFRRYDLSGDGRMEASELLTALRDLGIEVPDPTAGARAAAEADHCGTQPLSGAMTSRKAGQPSLLLSRQFSQRLSVRRRAELRLARSIVRLYDRAGDHRLSEAEFAQVVRDAIHAELILHATPRMRGKWAKPGADKAEPARTERLLAHPFAILRGRAADCQDSMSLQLMVKSSGHAYIGMYWAWLSMLIQVACGIVSGIGPYVAPGGSAALAQVLSVALVKLLWVAVLGCFSPCTCGLTNTIVALQFTSEGVSTILVLVASGSVVATSSSLAERLRLASFFLLLLPVFAPIFQRLYDSIVVNIIVNCCRKQFSAMTAFTEAIKLLLAVPAFLANVFGMSGATSGFNVAKLTGTVKGVMTDAERARRLEGKATTVTRKVRRRKNQGKEEAIEHDPNTLLMAGAITATHDVKARRREEADDDEDAGNDDDGGGDD